MAFNAEKVAFEHESLMQVDIIFFLFTFLKTERSEHISA